MAAALAVAAQAEAAAANAVKVMCFMHTMQVFLRKLRLCLRCQLASASSDYAYDASLLAQALGGHNVH
jgi:hypothetical protein